MIYHCNTLKATSMNVYNIRFKQARKALKISQKVMAHDLDTKQENISYIESGKSSSILPLYLLYLNKKGVNLNWIFNDNCSEMWVSDVSARSVKPNYEEVIQNKEHNQMILKCLGQNKALLGQSTDLISQNKTLLALVMESVK